MDRHTDPSVFVGVQRKAEHTSLTPMVGWQVADLRLYKVPFAKRDEKTYSLVVAVTNNRDRLKSILNLDTSSGFNWNDWFRRIE